MNAIQIEDEGTVMTAAGVTEDRHLGGTTTIVGRGTTNAAIVATIVRTTVAATIRGEMSVGLPHAGTTVGTSGGVTDGAGIVSEMAASAAAAEIVTETGRGIELVIASLAHADDRARCAGHCQVK